MTRTFQGTNPRGRILTRLAGVCGAVFTLALLVGGIALGTEGLLTGRVADHLAALKRRTEIPPAYAPIDFAWIAQLPAPEIRTVSDLAAVGEVEQHAVALAGYIVRVMPVPAQLGRRRAADWEFHVHLRLAPAQRCEYQDDPRNVVAVVTPSFQPPHTGWDFDVLSDLCREQPRVRLSGWLLYDYFTGPQVGKSRASPWSIHPVTQIEIWNSRDRSWDRLR